MQLYLNVLNGLTVLLLLSLYIIYINVYFYINLDQRYIEKCIKRFCLSGWEQLVDIIIICFRSCSL